MKTDWIKMTDRAPTEADLPVWGVNQDNEVFFFDVGDEWPPVHEFWAYWRPAKDDVPEPPREETQAEKDDVGFHAWYRDDGTFECGAHMTTWHAALAYEREQVANMLPDKKTMVYWSGVTPSFVYQAIEAIRARCGGGPGK